MRIDNSFLTASRLSTPLQLHPVSEPPERKSGFQNILDDLMEASNEASAKSREGTALLLTGQLDDLPGFQVESEKSSILFELNLTVRNKVIDAYKEIMQTSI